MNPQSHKKQINNFKKNIHNLHENFSQFYENNSKNAVAKKIQLYNAEKLKHTNFIEECVHGHDEINDIKTAINAEILFAIYNANKGQNTDNTIHPSWKNCHQSIVKDSRTLKKRMIKGLMHMTAELTCVVLCFIGDVVIFAPLAVLIEVEGQWNFLNLCEEIKQIYKERPIEAWLILAAFFILTIVFLTLTHHYIPNALFSKESERKNCLMILEEKIIKAEVTSTLEDILKVYHDCVINTKTGQALTENTISTLQLDKKPILEAYEILDNALWTPNKKNLFIASAVQILHQQAVS